MLDLGDSERRAFLASRLACQLTSDGWSTLDNIWASAWTDFLNGLVARRPFDDHQAPVRLPSIPRNRDYQNNRQLKYF